MATSSTSAPMDQLGSTELLREILITLRSIDGRLANTEKEIKGIRDKMTAQNRDELQTIIDETEISKLHVEIYDEDLSHLSKEQGDSTNTNTYNIANVDEATAAIVPGLASSMKSMGLSETEQDNELARQLRRIEKDYLSPELNSAQKAKPSLVCHITEKLVIPALKEQHSAVAYMGSSYEYTAVPGSDYDIQISLKIPSVKENRMRESSAEAIDCGVPDWRQVKGGPEKLLDGNGYFSTTKARNLVTSEIDKALTAKNSRLEFEGAEAIIRRATSGPAITLSVEWRHETISIDYVVCLQAADLKNSEYDLIGKPYKGKACAGGGDLWRQSYSKMELAKLRTFNNQMSMRKLLLLKIMKVMKKHQPQLGRFASYFYKNVLFMLDEQNPGAGWERVDLADRFKDMIKLIYKVLKEKNLPLHFNKRVNYLANENDGTIQVVANYLERIINKGNYLDLVKVVPSHT